MPDGLKGLSEAISLKTTVPLECERKYLTLPVTSMDARWVNLGLAATTINR